MKWYNTDRTQMVDVSAISAYRYEPADKDYPIMIKVSMLWFVCDGYARTVYGTEADGIYKMLTSEREVL